MQRKKRMDMTQGPLCGKIIAFMVPLVLTHLLQHFYEAADIIVVNLSGVPDAVGAVSSTSSFLSLIRNVFIGFSVGANVVVARNIGAKNKDGISRSVHTAICMSLLFGVIGSLIGIALVRPVFVAMKYEGALLDLAMRYAYIYLACLPFLALTNVLSAILHAQGNTHTSLLVLTSTGILNVGLNFVFVMFLGFSVEGVAMATAIANAVSASALFVYLVKKGEDCRIFLRKLRLHRVQFAEIARIGFPSGIQSALFSISNILIQSSILRVNNILTPIDSAYAPIVKGHAAAGSIETFVMSSLASVTSTASAFTAQNVGAGNYRRVKRSFGLICAVASVLSVIMTATILLLKDPLLTLYGVKKSGDLLSSLAYDAATTRAFIKWPALCIYAFMNACAGTVRGLGKSTLSAVVTFVGTCAFRILWIYTAFQVWTNLSTIYLSYMISWLITGLAFLVILMLLLRRRIQNTKETSKEATA